MSKKFALQLYSVKDSAAADMRGTLSRVSKLGFYGVEFAGYGGLSAEEMAEELRKNSLVAAGTHVSLPQLLDTIDAEIEYNKIIGNKNIICSWSTMGSDEEAAAVGKQLEALAQKCAAAGLVFGYHNHEHEFVMGDDGYYFDTMMANAPSVVPQFDVAWVVYAGLDPLFYLDKYADRNPFIHVKELKAMGTKEGCVCGEGIVDLKSVVNMKNRGLVLEQEGKDDPWGAVEQSLAYLKTL